MRNFYVTAIPWKSKKLRINYRSILPSIPSIFTRWAEKNVEIVRKIKVRFSADYEFLLLSSPRKFEFYLPKIVI